MTLINVNNFESIDAAVEALYAAAAAGQPSTLYFPAGVHVLSTKLTIKGITCTICGDGDSTIIRWLNKDGGIQFIGGQRHRTALTVKNLCLETAANYGGMALDLSWLAGPKTKCCAIENVRIQPTDRSTELMWTIGIRLKNATDVFLNGVYIYGSITGALQKEDQNYGIVIDSDMPSAGYDLHHVKVDAYRTGISVRQCEGIYLWQPEITACRVCIDIHRSMAFQIQGGHLDYLRHGIVVTQSERISIANMSWIKSHTLGTASHALRFTDFWEEVEDRKGRLHLGEAIHTAHIPRYEADPNLVGNEIVDIANCHLQFDTSHGAFEKSACGVVITRRRVGNIDRSEALTISLGSIVGFPDAGVFLEQGTRGNKVIDTRIECGQQIVNKGDNPDIRPEKYVSPWINKSPTE